MHLRRMQVCKVRAEKEIFLFGAAPAEEVVPADRCPLKSTAKSWASVVYPLKSPPSLTHYSFIIIAVVHHRHHPHTPTPPPRIRDESSRPDLSRRLMPSMLIASRSSTTINQTNTSAI